MNEHVFQTRQPVVVGNPRLRVPQQLTYQALQEFARTQPEEREVGIVLPVGCGKSGCITLAPFAFRSARTLVVAPGVKIASQLFADFDASRADMFYTKTSTLSSPPFPEPVEIRGTTTNRGDLDEAEVVITNIQQLQGEGNRWLSSLPSDYFDLILFDEGHHSVAATWADLKARFPAARIVNFSATPLRADGQRMAGRIVYSYPIYEAMQHGYVKWLKAIQLNPRTLRFIRHEGDQEIEVSLEEVRRLGEQDADFRRSIVTSKESLDTIVDASIRELDRMRSETGEGRLKIIASALNYLHCSDIVEAYRARGRRAEYVHSREDSAANERVFRLLDNHELDVIVQVRKLGEGFDHRYLAVAAVFSIFANLSPFVQFIGRIMRVIVQDDPAHPLNRGTVIYHAGANVASRWSDFQEYSGADQLFFDALLPVRQLDFSDPDDLRVVDGLPKTPNTVQVRGQTEVAMEEIPLIGADDTEAIQAIQTLREHGYSPEQVRRTMELQPVPTIRARVRQAARLGLDARVRNEVGRILGERHVSHEGHDLDRSRLGRTNFIVLKAAIDKQINKAVGRRKRERHEFTRDQLETIEARFRELVESAVREVFDA